jgi:hypothetical protein
MVKTEIMPIRPSRNFVANHNPSEEEISARAHQIFLKRGGEPGHDMEDWLKAERELMNNENVPSEGWALK